MKNIRVIISWILVLLWMIIIFNFSSKPANISDNQSLSVLSKFAGILSVFGVSIDTSNHIYNFIIRKIGHITEYFILGILVCNAIRYSFKKVSIKYIIIYSLVLCILYSISDEIHQLFVPGRTGRIYDVGIDSIGILFGVFCRGLMILG